MELLSTEPVIVAPVMRFLGIAEAARSIAFYRDVLGFEVQDRDGGIEAIHGPVRIRFGAEDYAPGEWEHPRSVGSGIVFFQTNGVAALHSAIRARGGAVSGLEKMNGIKMQVFEIRDPDGHTLWFGESYEQPQEPAPPPMMRQALPELPFDDVTAAVA